MKISDILRAKGTSVVSMPPDASVRELVAALVEHKIGAVVVTDGAALLGIVSERDIVHRLHVDGAAALDAELAQLMSTDLAVCTPADEVDTIAATMTERRIRHMPVLTDGRLAGIVSIGDVVKNRIQQLEAESEQLEQYITG